MRIEIQARNIDTDEVTNHVFTLVDPEECAQYRKPSREAMALLNKMDSRILNFLEEESSRNKYIINLCGALNFIAQPHVNYGEGHTRDDMTGRVGAKICSIIQSNEGNDEVIREELAEATGKLMHMTRFETFSFGLFPHEPTEEEMDSFRETPDDIFSRGLTMKFVD